MNPRWGWILGAAAGAAAAGGVVRLLKHRDGAEPALHERVSGNGAAARAPRRRVVILGAGFGGLAAAEALATGDHRALQVTLVDRRNYHLFSPFLYHVSAGLVDPMHIAYPARAFAARHGFRFRESVVESIDLRGRRVVTDEGEIPYDDLVIALGATTNYFGMAEVQEHSLPLKTMGDGIAVRNRVIDAFEAADVESDPERRRELLTFVIVGGGATGVELAGGLYGLIHYVLLKHYPTLRAEEVTLMVVEAMGQLLPGWEPFLVQTTHRALEEKGILIRLNAPVVRVTPELVELKDGQRIHARTVVWAAGVRPVGVVADLDVPKVRGGRLQVNEYLELPDYPGVFVVGDVAGYLDPATEKPVPALAAVAEQQGRAVGANLRRRMRDEPMQPYRYHLLGQSLSLGRNEAAIAVKGLKLHGFFAWVGWRTAHLYAMRGWRNRLGVLFDWAFAYIFLRDTLRLEAEPEREAQREAVKG
jgi:NADH dehydrogenase